MPNHTTAAERAQDIRLTDDGMLVLWGIIAARVFPTGAFGQQVVAAFREHFKNALDAYARQQVEACYQVLVNEASCDHAGLKPADPAAFKATLDQIIYSKVAAERVAWGSKLCSHHQIPEVSCDVCNHYLWGQWIVEYNEKSVAFIVSVSHPNIRYPLKHGQSVAAAVRQRGV